MSHCLWRDQKQSTTLVGEVLKKNIGEGNFDKYCQYFALQFYKKNCMLNGSFVKTFHVVWKFCWNFLFKMSELAIFVLLKKLTACMQAAYKICMQGGLGIRIFIAL